jgi:DNA (cytosine-5)-methyltransferase 1
MKHLDLFSGIGGFALAARWAGFETVAFCECDPFCQGVLRKHWPTTKIHDDVRGVDGSDYRGVELITGGYPCQPFSLVGKRRGAEDDRHLWPEMRRIIGEARPAWVVSENVAGLITMGLDEVLTDLESLGYAARALVIPACAVGALHIRERVWVVANANGRDDKPGPLMRPGVCGEAGGEGADGDACSAGWGFARWAEAEPGFPLVADGIPDRVARYRATGNAIVPQVAYELLRSMVTYNA